MEMVREALKTLGNSAKPTEIAAYIHEHFNIAVANGIASSYKSALLRPVQEDDVRPSMTSQERRFLRELIERVGADQVQNVLNEMDGW